MSKPIFNRRFGKKSKRRENATPVPTFYLNYNRSKENFEGARAKKNLIPPTWIFKWRKSLTPTALLSKFIVGASANSSPSNAPPGMGDIFKIQRRETTLSNAVQSPDKTKRHKDI